jgi:DNA-binding transcriptional MerR regulator
MPTAEAIRERVRNEQRLIERLQTVNVRFADAQLERLWAIQSAHELGLSIRQIAAATGLSSSRIHQVINANDLVTIPIWTTPLHATAEPQTRITAEVKLLRQCSEWLKQLEKGEEVMVNLRPETDLQTEYVRFDTPRVIRILERIAADLDQLAEGAPTQADSDPQSERKRRLAETPKPKRRLSTREARNALRAELKLPPR